MKNCLNLSTKIVNELNSDLNYKNKAYIPLQLFRVYNNYSKLKANDKSKNQAQEKYESKSLELRTSKISHPRKVQF